MRTDWRGGRAGPLAFEKSGAQTIRLRQREDGISIDQIVLGAGAYRPHAARRAEERYDAVSQ